MDFALKSHSKQKTSPPAKTRVDTIKPRNKRTFMSTDYGAFGTYEYETVDGTFIKLTKKAEGVEIYIPQANFEEFLMNLKQIGFIKKGEQVVYNENDIIEGTFFKLTNPETVGPGTRTEIYIPHKVSEVTYDIAKYSRGGKRKSRRKTSRSRKTSRRRK